MVFRRAAKHFPAFQLWTDDYLTENYGNLEVMLEAKREKEEVPVGANLRSGVPFVFVGAGKERLIQLLDYSSAAP